MIGPFLKVIKDILAVVIVCFLYLFFGVLAVVGAVKAWDGIKGVVGGDIGSVALFFVGAMMVAVAWFGGRRVISYISLKLTSVDDINEGGM